MSTYFDTSLDPAPVTEQDTTPVLPEERHIFELVGFERSEPDQWRKEGGIKWTFLVYDQDGRPFEFQDEQYTFWRTTGLTRDGKPNFNVGTYANEWASALLGRELGVEANFSISELRGKRMSAMVVWEPQRSDPKRKTVKLASLRHVPLVPVGNTNGAAPKAQVSADPTSDDVDRALLISKLEKKVARAQKLKLPSLDTFQKALAAIETASIPQIEAIIENLDDEFDAAVAG